MAKSRLTRSNMYPQLSRDRPGGLVRPLVLEVCSLQTSAPTGPCGPKVVRLRPRHQLRAQTNWDHRGWMLLHPRNPIARDSMRITASRTRRRTPALRYCHFRPRFGAPHSDHAVYERTLPPLSPLPSSRYHLPSGSRGNDNSPSEVALQHIRSGSRRMRIRQRRGQ
jgi:hypothetical protein